jgi:hypothetical protein
MRSELTTGFVRKRTIVSAHDSSKYLLEVDDFSIDEFLLECFVCGEGQ